MKARKRKKDRSGIEWKVRQRKKQRNKEGISQEDTGWQGDMEKAMGKERERTEKVERNMRKKERNA